MLKIRVMKHRPDPSHLESRRLWRAVWIVGLLISGTLAALVLAWAYPEATVWHFLGVTQLVPVFYLCLSVWAAWPLGDEAEE